MYPISDGLLAISPFEVFAILIGCLVAGNVIHRVWEWKWSPEGIMIRGARRDSKKRLALMHYPEQTAYFYVAKEDHTVKKNDMEKSANYYLVNGIYKFKDTSGQATELLSGDLPVTNHTLNIPMPIAVKVAAQFHQFSELLKKNNVPIDGFEDLAVDIIMGHEQEVAQFKDKIQKSPNPGNPGNPGAIEDPFFGALEARGVTDTDTSQRLKKILKFIDEHKEEIDKIKMKSQPFVWQPVIRAFDDLMAFTSRNFHQAKITIETAVLREQQQDLRQMITLGVMAAIIILSMFAGIYLLTHK
jgi:hypothetical protein